MESLEGALAIQGDLHDFLNRIVEVAEDGSFPKRVALTESINARVRIRFVYQPHATENRLYAIWQTAESSVLEFLYLQLAQSLAKDGFTAYGHCPTCGKFIYRRTRHGQRYCSDACRALASFRRRRDGQDDQSDRVPVAKGGRAKRSREVIVTDEPSANLGVTRILRFREVHARTQLSRVTIWRMERRGEFPARRQLSTNSVGWIEREVEEWLVTRCTARHAPVDQRADGSGGRRANPMEERLHDRRQHRARKR